MPTYLTPGVYVEEVPAQSKPIEGVGTSVAAFVGLAPGGPVDEPVRISNWTQFARTFSDAARPDDGPFMEGAFLAHSVYGFFQNGGSLCYVVRVGAADGDAGPPQAALSSAGDGDGSPLRALARGDAAGQIVVDVTEEPAPPAPPAPEGDGGKEKAAAEPQPTYTLRVRGPGGQREEHAKLTLKTLVRDVNQRSKLITLQEEAGPAIALAPGTYTLEQPAAPPSAVTAGDFEGDVARREGLGSLAAVDDVTMLCVPDLMTLAGDGADAQIRDLQGKLIAHAEGHGDRMVLLDAPPGLSPQQVLDWRVNTAGYDSKFATLYWPHVEVQDPLTRQPLMVPPCGHVAGVWARVDGSRGVHKAPANEVVLGTNGLGFQITHDEQGALNRVGINCIRAFPARGIRIWGARTLSSDPEWRYLNVRRLFSYASKSIMLGTQWAVFEPNDEPLWTQLRIAASNFLERTWRQGALFGATPDQAFFVKCDAETNPPDLIEAGQVTIEIGIAPVKPAEFVVFRIAQFSDADASA